MERKDKILEIAKQEFIEKGFSGASMRNIAKKVGITATALYRHYKNKEEIFEAVVSPAVKAWRQFCMEEAETQPELAWQEGLDAMWEEDVQMKRVVDMVYANLEVQKLLFFGSKGTKYEDFFHELVVNVQKGTLSFMEELKNRGISVNDVDEKDMHLLLSAQYTATLEMIKHDYSYEEALHYAETVACFFREGWRKYLGF